MDCYKAAPDQDIIDAHIAAPRKRRVINPSSLKTACDKLAEHQTLLDAGITELDIPLE
jgi:hypothetical protein